MSRCLIRLLFTMVEIAEFWWKRLSFNHWFMTQMLISCIKLFNLPQIEVPHAPFYKYPSNCSVFLHSLWRKSLGAPKLVLSAGNACITCKQKTLNGCRALCGLGILLVRGRKRSLCWGGGCLLWIPPCTAQVWKAKLGHPRVQVSQEIAVFFGAGVQL